MTEGSAPSDVLIEAGSRIPIRNAWYLLLYAWDMAKFRRGRSVEAEASPSLLGLLASILASATRDILRRQLGRSFAIQSRTIRGIRGRIDLATSLKHLTFQRGEAHCAFSELSVDTLKNRILRATLERLASDPRLCHPNAAAEAGLRHELRALVRALQEVPLVPISSADFSRLQLGRNDRDYALPLAICALVHRLEMPTDATGDHVMIALLRDEIAFHQLFERFVRNFCHFHFPDCDVRPETLMWPDELGCELVPAMRTDITITTEKLADHRLVIDTKYYVSALAASPYGGDRFRSNNLYQLYTYLRTQEDRSAAHRAASGMLLYPTAGRELNETMLIQGHRIRIVTIDLSQQWETIEEFLKKLVASELELDTESYVGQPRITQEAVGRQEGAYQ